MSVLFLIKPGANFNAGRNLIRSCDFQINDVVFIQPTMSLIHEHYREHAGKDFFDRLVLYMLSGEIAAIRIGVHPAALWTRPGSPSVVEAACLVELRKALMEYRQFHDAEGPRNFFHCSDSLEAGQRECQLWFQY